MIFGFKNMLVAASFIFTSTISNASTYETNIPSFVKEYGSSSVLRLEYVNKVITRFSNAPTHDKLEAVNILFNSFTYISDIQLWGTMDYWATSLEFIGSGAGDCEDFALAKYQTLLKMGVNEKHLKLEYVEVAKNHEAHLVLNYYEAPNSTPLVLDSIVGAILPSNERPDLFAFFAFNKHSFQPNMSLDVEISNTIGILKKWSQYLHRTNLKKPNFDLFEM